ncbi:MAG: hypothetical protein EOO38_27680, partial [Cytophagaceae bacterium]
MPSSSTLKSNVATLQAQVAALTAENLKLKEDAAMQGHAYRGLQLGLDETKEDMADMEARMNAFSDAQVAVIATPTALPRNGRTGTRQRQA